MTRHQAAWAGHCGAWHIIPRLSKKWSTNWIRFLVGNIILRWLTWFRRFKSIGNKRGFEGDEILGAVHQGIVETVSPSSRLHENHRRRYQTWYRFLHSTFLWKFLFVGGKLLPKGCALMIAAMSIHRSSRVCCTKTLKRDINEDLRKMPSIFIPCGRVTSKKRPASVFFKGLL